MTHKAKIDGSLFAWLRERLEELPPDATLTVTWRRDKSGHLSREFEVREKRVLTPEEAGAHT